MGMQMPNAAPATPPNQGDVAQAGIDDFESMVGKEEPGDADVTALARAEQVGNELEAAANAAEAEANAEGEAAEEVDPDAEAPASEQIHGLDGDAILSAIKEGRLPDELLDKLTITQRINGEDVPVTIKEARENGMRLSDYSRSKNELRAERDKFEGAQQDFVSMVKSWKVNTPDQRFNTRMMLERWMGSDVFMDIVRDVADEHLKVEAMGPAGKEAFFEARRVKQELAQERWRAQQLERRSEQATRQQGQETFAKRVNTMRDAAFAKHKIDMSAPTDQLFRANLRGLWDGRSDVTQELADQAAQATLEDLARLRAQLAESAATADKAKAGAKRQLPAKPAPRGGASGGATTRPKRGSIADFDRLLGTG